MTLLLTPILLIASVSAGAGSASGAPSAPDILRSLELRQRYDAMKNFGTTSIFIDSVAVHHTHNEASTVLWKDEAGRWQWSQVSEVGPGGLLPVARKLEYKREHTLNEEQSAVLDRVLGNRRLYSGQFKRSGEVGIGAPRHTMEIITPVGRTVITWDGLLEGDAGEIADIALGRG